MILKKIIKKSNFICICQKNVVPLHGFHNMGYSIQNIALLKEFMQKGSISGHESGTVGLYMKAISPYVEKINIDVLGNCISCIKSNTCTTGVSEPRKIMIVAHADEVGLMVSHIDERGFLYFQESGAVESQVLQGVEVSVEGKNDRWIRGVIGKKPIHLQKSQCGEKENVIENLWIDIAACETKDDEGNIISAKKWAEEHVELGAQVVFYRHMEQSEQEGVYNGAGFDDKVGLFILVELAKRLKGKMLNTDVYFVASAQEELGGRGASVAAATIQPDECVVIDVTHATDYPAVSVEQYGDIRLGEGPVLFSGPNINKILYKHLQSAGNRTCACQKEPMARPTGTDANAVQITGKGIATAVLGIPCRYMHTPNERISMNDVEKAISILEAYIVNNE